jgi:NAD-dependent SIR2 family protein deacetylase
MASIARANASGSSTTELKGERTMATEAYCVKCREKREMKDEKEVTMKNGRPALEGVCPECGTKLFRLQSTKKAAASS